jgi:chromosome segregation ATPase
MFKGAGTETKIAVLEERLSSYEVMMKKIDEAIQIMGKTSQNISKMLAVHEQKIETNAKTDDVVFEKLRIMESKNTEDHERVIQKFEVLEGKIDERINKIDDKVNGVVKFRWLIVGGLILVSAMLSAPHIIVDILTPDQGSPRMERSK